MSEPVPASSRAALALSLAAPFALVGGALGLLVSFPVSSREAAAFVGVPALVAAALGAAWGALPPRATSARALRVAAFMLSVVAASVLAALAVGAAEAAASASFAMTAPVGPVAAFGALVGVFAALPCTALVYAAHAASLDARPGTLARASARRVAWLRAAALVGAAGWILGFAVSRSLRPVAACLGGTAVCVVIAALDALALRTFARLVDGLATAQPGAPIDTAAPTLDVGLGDGVWIASADATAHPYRARDRAVRVVRGALLRVGPLLARRAVVSAALGVGGVAAIVVVEATRPPEPAPVVVAPPMARAADAPRLPWYGQQPPIAVHVEGAPEDVVGLRWDSSEPEAALSVTRIDGRTFATRWRTDPVHSQWSSESTHVAVSADRVFLTDSEGFVRLYDLATGRVVTTSKVHRALEVCARADGEAGVWVRTGEDDGGAMVDGGGVVDRAPRPAWCPPGYPPACAAKGHAGARCARMWPNHPDERDAWEEGDVGVSFATERASGHGINRYRQRGYDPVTGRTRWEAVAPLAEGDELHADPRLLVELARGRIFEAYQLQSGRFVLGARDATTGAVLWRREPPRAAYGTNFISITASDARLYVVIDWRVEVLDPSTGETLGVIW
jgi:hypothetical protein